MMDKIVQVMKALGDETRLKILYILSKRKICAKGLAKHLNITEAAVSQHIRVLKDVSIISGEKAGYYVYYNIQKHALQETVVFLEQIGHAQIADNCKFGVHMPEDCTTLCNGSKSNCCKKYNK
jgi:ArsR family transcriptional regulator